jgi:hypothetical protein
MSFFSSRIRLDWQSFVQEMDTKIKQGIGETTTPMEFRRVALAVAYALSNPGECLFWECVMVFNL